MAERARSSAPAGAALAEQTRSSAPAAPDETPQQRAERVRDGLWANDRASQWLGMRIAEVGPGTATVTMTVGTDMVNGHSICHGGLIATLADSAFAFACNAYDEATVASGFAIELLAPARLGDVLTARCREVAKGGRGGLYDVEVSDQRGVRIAVFRGRSHTYRGRPAVPVAV